LWALFLFGAVRVLELNKIHHGDCLGLMNDIPDKSVDMILCDLPYGTTQNEWDSIIPLDNLWEQYERLIKDNGAIILTAQTPFDKVLGASNLKLLKYEWIWNKPSGTGHLNAKKMPMKNHENILVFYKKLPTYNPQMTKGIAYKTKRGKKSTNYGNDVMGYNGITNNNGERYPLSTQLFNTEKGYHPTQKPVALFEYLIKTYTNEGDTVLDNCMGSGTTALASLNAGRSFIGIEKERKYVDIASKRIKEHTTQLTLI
jgi:site-specific DNA-methyltransferase (adenine-specific)